MKALEKERNRRYETANGLGRDVERYLHDEPVLACPASTGYRLRKFVRRNKGPVLKAALLLFALIAGVAVSTSQAVRAEKAEAETRADRDKAVGAGPDPGRMRREPETFFNFFSFHKSLFASYLQ